MRSFPRPRSLFLLSAVLAVVLAPSTACQSKAAPPPDGACPAFAAADPLLGKNEHADVTVNAGKTPGTFSVSSGGDALYQIAFAVPPDRLAPRLALSFNSALGEGLSGFGMGFALEGLSAVTRCGSNVAQDGFLHGVRNDTGDHLCLDNLRLVEVGHVEHSPEGPYTELRTFPDTFQQVRAYDGADPAKGPAWFAAYTKSGRILEYGRSASGQVMGKKGVVRAWWVTQECDRHGNAILTTYRNDTDPLDGHTVTHVPRRIDYTAHLSSPVLAPSRAVEFDWTDWNIHTTAYTGGMAVSRRPHIETIRMLGPNDVPVRGYRFTWDIGATGRGRLSRITECAEDDSAKCRPPTQLGWLDAPGKGFTRIDTGITYSTPEIDPGFTWLLADTTGDGLSDLVRAETQPGLVPGSPPSIVWSVAPNLGGSFGKVSTWTVTAAPSLLGNTTTGGLGTAERVFTVAPHDYEQRGLGDLLFHDPNGSEIRRLRSLPQGGFDEQGTGIFVPGPTNPALIVTQSTALYADIDGDGVLDLIQCNDLNPSSPGQPKGEWTLRRWTPAGFGAAEPIPTFGGRGCFIKRYIHVVDLDRDGKAELLVPPQGYPREEASLLGQASPQCQGACTYATIAWVSGPGDTLMPTLGDSDLPAPNWAAGSGRVLFLDVNGDGLPDAIETNTLGGLSTHVLWTFLNTGAGFQSPAMLSLPNVPAPQDDYLDLAAPIDYDGDGQMDLLVPMKYAGCPGGKDHCWVVLRSTAAGDGHFVVQPTNIPLSGDFESFAKGTDTLFMQTMIPRVTDVNGDGRHDVIMPIDGRFSIFLNEGPVDLLSTVTDGMNPLDPGDPGFLPNVTITYGSLIDHARTAGIDPASAPAEAETYLPRTDPQNDCTYPRACVVGTKRIVASYTLNDGQNQPHAFSMRYRDGRAHRLGRGDLAFGEVFTIDDETQAGHAEIYDNVTYDPKWRTFPFAGHVVHAQSWVPDLPGQPFLLSALRFTDRALAVVGTNSDATYFTYPSSTRTRKEETALPLGGPETLLQFVEAQALIANGNLLDTYDTLELPDEYGTLTNETHTTTGVDDVRTVARTVQNDGATWRIGEVTAETACSTSLALTQCRTTNRTFDAAGEIATEDRGDPADPETKLALVYTRDALGNLTAVTADDAYGHHRAACVTYDGEGIFPYAFGNPTGQVSYVAFDPGLGVQIAAKDPNGLVTSWQHDAYGRTTLERRPDKTTTAFGLQRAKDGGSGAWWALHTTEATTGGTVSGADLDSLGRPVRTWVKGPLVPSCSAVGSCTSTPTYQEDTVYDHLGRVASRSKPWQAGDPPGTQLFTTYQYDNLNRAITETSPWSAQTTYGYAGNTVLATGPGTSSLVENDAWGRPVKVTDSLGGETGTTYGPFGMPWDRTMPGGLALTRKYDAYGRVRVETDPDRGVTTIDYDGFDERLSSQDALGRWVFYNHDALGRLIQKQDADGITSWHYDDPGKGLGRLADVVSPTGHVTSYTYDGVGRMLTETLAIGGEMFTTTLGYDPVSRVATIESPAALGKVFRVRNVYDLEGTLIAVKDDVTNASYWQLDGVNGVGQTSGETFGNGVTTQRDYFEEKGTLKHILTTKGGAKIQDLSYAYDARLNLTSRTDALQKGVFGALSEHFSYDALDRVTCSQLDKVCAVGGSCSCDQAVGYLPNGNIDTKSDVGASPYVYDPAHPHAVVQAGAGVYGNDAVGNQIARPGATIGYTAFDLPKVVTPTGNGATVTLDYDGDQARIRKTTATDETVYAGLYERGTHTVPPSTEHRYYVRNDERVIAVVTRTAQDPLGAVEYLHADHLGSTDVVTSAQGSVVERRSFDMFGAQRNPAWGASGPGAYPVARTTVGFTGHEADAELGLVNAKGRMYDPKVGRFLTTDPLVSQPLFSQSWNPYSYVRNSPLNFVDPSGFDPVPPPASPVSVPAPYVEPSVDPEYLKDSSVQQIIADGCMGLECGKAQSGDHDADMPAGDAPDGSWKDARVVQVGGGALAGFFIGAVPFGGIGEQVLSAVGVLPQGTRDAQIGKGIGETLGGVLLAGGGVVGEVVAGVGAATGIGAPPGAALAIASAGAVTAGASNVAAGVRAITIALSTGSGSAGEPPKWGNPKSTPTYGHSFLKHGAGVKNTRNLMGQAKGSNVSQGQWLNDEGAAEFLTRQRASISAPTVVDIPEGMGQVIRPDGTIVPATRAVLVPGQNGGYRTAYPVE